MKFLLRSWPFFLLLILSVPYYFRHLGSWGSLAGGIFLTTLVWAMVYVGHRLFAAGHAFPMAKFVAAVLLFSLIRWGCTYLILQHHLPADTVFHYPGRAVWFIVPTTAALLFTGFGRAQYLSGRENPETAPPPLLRFRSGGQEVLLPIAEVLNVQANGEYLIYRTQERKISRFQRLKEAEIELAPYGFIRVHRSHLVARSAIRAYTPSEVDLVDGTKIPVSKTFRDRLTVLGGYAGSGNFIN